MLDVQGIPFLSAGAWGAAAGVWALCWALGALAPDWPRGGAADTPRGRDGLAGVALRMVVGAPIVSVLVLALGQEHNALFAVPWPPLILAAMAVAVARAVLRAPEINAGFPSRFSSLREALWSAAARRRFRAPATEPEQCNPREWGNSNLPPSDNAAEPELAPTKTPAKTRAAPPPPAPPAAAKLTSAPPPAANPTAADFLFLAGWACVLLWLALALGPALSPPLNYDTLEYHLGVLPHWFAVRLIEPMPHVFYSAQPLGVEALTMLGAVIERTPWGLSSGLIQWGFLVLAAALMPLAAAALGVSRRLAPWLALAFLAHPVIFKLELDRLTDLAGAIYLLAGIALLGASGGPAAFAGLGDRARSGGFARTAFALGLLAGGAIATKWTNVATTALPLAALFAWSLRSRRAAGPADGSAAGAANGAANGAAGGNAPSPIAECAAFAGGAAAALGPWMLYLWIAVGNPVAPFAAGLFPRAGWGPERFAFLMSTHGAVSPFQAAYWISLASRLTSFKTGPPWIMLSIIALAVGWRLRARAFAPEPAGDPTAKRFPAPALILMLACALAFLAWGRLTAAEARFLAPVYAASILILGASLTWLAAALPLGRPCRNAAWLALGPVFLAWPALWSQANMLARAPYLPYATGRLSEGDFLEFGLGATADFFRAINALPPGSRPLAFAEARPYYLRPPTETASVFDANPLQDAIQAAIHGHNSLTPTPSATPDDIEANLVKAGFTHLVVNEHEAGRLLQFHPPPGLEKDPEFLALRRMGPPAYGELARCYMSWIGAVPSAAPDEARRAAFDAFTARARAKAVWIRPVDGRRPAMWISPLGKPRPR